MIRRLSRLILWAAVVLGAGYVVARLVRGRSEPPGPPGPWPPSGDREPRPSMPPTIPQVEHVPMIREDQPIIPRPEPAPIIPHPAPAEPAEPGPQLPESDPEPGPQAKAWVAPNDGGCPPTHPVKAKLSSKIFHLPGMANYDRTIPDRCYVSAEAAEADGLRRAKR